MLFNFIFTGLVVPLSLHTWSVMPAWFRMSSLRTDYRFSMFFRPFAFVFFDTTAWSCVWAVLSKVSFGWELDFGEVCQKGVDVEICTNFVWPTVILNHFQNFSDVGRQSFFDCCSPSLYFCYWKSFLCLQYTCYSEKMLLLRIISCWYLSRQRAFSYYVLYRCLE